MESVIELNTDTIAVVKNGIVTVEQRVFGSDKITTVSLTVQELKKLLERAAQV